MTESPKQKISFLELASRVLAQHKKALTSQEIWEAAAPLGLVSQLASSGKTPEATLGSLLYTDVKKPTSSFSKVGARPARFLLKTQLSSLSEQELTQQASQPQPSTKAEKKFGERELHPLLTWFADRSFGAHCRTIYHEKSQKKGEKHNQWVHPDVVAFSLPTQTWDPEVVRLSKASGAQLSKLYSFELKIALDFSSLRECFFQAVSNSSWAHEGYLVASRIDEDPEFHDEIRRLSQSFGIGVIRLDLDQPNDSFVLLPAQERNELDWATIDRIAALNPDFRGFIASVVKSMQINEPALNGFDTILDDGAAEALALKLRKPQ